MAVRLAACPFKKTALQTVELALLLLLLEVVIMSILSLSLSLIHLSPFSLVLVAAAAVSPVGHNSFVSCVSSYRGRNKGLLPPLGEREGPSLAFLLIFQDVRKGLGAYMRERERERKTVRERERERTDCQLILTAAHLFLSSL